MGGDSMRNPTLEKCEGCGYCCRMEPCAISVGYHGEWKTSCRSLVEHDGRHWCGILESAREKSPQVADAIEKALGIGVGCGENNSDRIMYLLGREVHRLDMKEANYRKNKGM